MRQPRVIAEVLGGILLGPSVFGRIPGFTKAIFPPESMPTLSTAANIGLILFLFIVGLEVDLRLLLKNWRIALGVGAAGMALPFGLGCGIAYGLYHQFRTESGLAPIQFGTYMLFVGVAMAITAFPVLCRILTELNLLQTQVGVVVLSAGVGNDIVGWILLALCVALVNAGSGISALWVLLVAVGYVLFLAYLVRPAFLWLLRRTRSLQNGPSQAIVGLTILMVFASAFFTAVIGVHPIFGAFLIGIICPHDGGFAIKLTEKIEDLVAVFFLPLYFALSGLSTNIGLLDNGITWAYVVGVISVAFIGKMVGGTLAAKCFGMVWRESFTIGTLMSCKGLVELIVLNIGLTAKILSQRTFTIFVVMALITTFATTPLVSFLFPPAYQKKLAAWKRGEIDWDGNQRSAEGASEAPSIINEKQSDIRSLLVCLRLDSLPSLFTFVSLLSGSEVIKPKAKTHPARVGKHANNDYEELQSERTLSSEPPLQVHGLRVLELTDRLSSVMKESEIDDWSAKDPVVNAFYTFGQLSNVAVSAEAQLVPPDSYAIALNERARERAADMVLLPWSKTGDISELEALGYTEPAHGIHAHESYHLLVGKLLANAQCTTAVFVSNGFGSISHEGRPDLHRMRTGISLRSGVEQVTTPIMDRSHHIFMPYLGGVDDHVALRFILRLARNSSVTATIILVNTTGEHDGHGETTDLATSKTNASVAITPVFGGLSEAERSFFYAMRDSVPANAADRIVFDTMETSHPLQDIPQRVAAEVGLNGRNAGDLVVLGRGPSSPSRGYDNDQAQTLGELADAIISANVKASVVVMRAGRNTS